MTIEFKRVYTDAPQPTKDVDILRVQSDGAVEQADCVAVEEPLEIRLGYTFLGKPAQRSISVTLRTPGDDRELATGFLFGEAVIESVRDIKSIDFCESDSTESTDPTNIVRITVADDVDVDMASVQRNFYTTSSCGVCGKASIEALELQDCAPLTPTDFSVGADIICQLPDKLRAAQPLFSDTGGIHAAGLFDERGDLVALREDVGRHNAFDKLVGARLLDEKLPLERSIVVLSGRASFELLQKALMARAPMVVAVGAPSSLAVELAKEFGITLIGFTRQERFNIYCHAERIG